MDSTADTKSQFFSKKIVALGKIPDFQDEYGHKNQTDQDEYGHKNQTDRHKTFQNGLK